MYTKSIAFAVLAITSVNSAALGLCRNPASRIVKADAVLAGNGLSGSVLFTPASKGGLQVQVNIEGLKEPGEYPFHIHVKPLTKADNNCAATGGHLNPFHIDSKTTKCNKNDILQTCELGDLSGAFGKLNPDSSGKATLKFTDPAISFQSGKTGILGHSVVVHAPNGDRLACGNIIGCSYKRIGHKI